MTPASPTPEPTAAPPGEGSPAPAAAEPATASPLAPEPEAAASEAPREGPIEVSAADNIVEGVAQQNETIGDVLSSLDQVALETSTFRISVLDMVVVGGGIALLVFVAFLLTRAVRGALHRFTRLSGSQVLLAEKLISILIWAAAFFIAIDLIGVDLTALAVFGGAFGLAIGFGLQKTFGNLIAGIILLLDKSIKPGDVIAVADTAGQETFGQIRKIGIRAVSVTTRDEREYLIPNENLMINQVENWSYSSRNVRMQVHVGVSYKADMDLAEKLMLEAAGKARRVLKSPAPTVWMTEYGDSSVNFIIHCWIVDPEEGVGNVRSEVLKNLWWLLKENDIEIPFPQRDLNLRDGPQMQDLIDALRGDARP
ncbi:mechanosensitive ion channel family protein [Erythrobacter sp.]|jgi:small-conductance mechanosensitive channel|uniref:mechanosensitive ion channel family protein n=1 Tax=Erythrobacter sp. TaxID=1042 RepID=UPI002EAC848F|nr:mechanosensitive ion channel domain-containing protein [Erythrobacter sp.]